MSAAMIEILLQINHVEGEEKEATYFATTDIIEGNTYLLTILDDDYVVNVVIT
jgi:hypothetical protein